MMLQADPARKPKIPQRIESRNALRQFHISAKQGAFYYNKNPAPSDVTQTGLQLYRRAAEFITIRALHIFE